MLLKDRPDVILSHRPYQLYSGYQERGNCYLMQEVWSYPHEVNNILKLGDILLCIDTLLIFTNCFSTNCLHARFMVLAAMTCAQSSFTKLR